MNDVEKLIETYETSNPVPSSIRSYQNGKWLIVEVPRQTWFSGGIVTTYLVYEYDITGDFLLKSVLPGRVKGIPE